MAVVASFVTGALLAALPAQPGPSEGDSDPPRLTWLARDGAVEWTTPLTGVPH